MTLCDLCEVMHNGERVWLINGLLNKGIMNGSVAQVKEVFGEELQEWKVTEVMPYIHRFDDIVVAVYVTPW